MILQYVALYIQIFPANQGFHRPQLQCSQSIFNTETVFASILNINIMININKFLCCIIYLLEKFHQSNDQ